MAHKQPTSHTPASSTAKHAGTFENHPSTPANAPAAATVNISTLASSNSRGLNVPDPNSLITARHNYHELQSLLGQLNNKLSGVSNQVDKEFLGSYRVHMLSIQSEVRHLKQEVSRSEQRLNDDVTVARLESETKWFIEECTRLRNHYDSMKSDCEQMKNRLKGMVEQKEYLSAQLKALVKRNRVLRDTVSEMRGGHSSIDAKLDAKNQTMPKSATKRLSSAESVQSLDEPSQSLSAAQNETPAQRLALSQSQPLLAATGARSWSQRKLASARLSAPNLFQSDRLLVPGSDSIYQLQLEELCEERQALEDQLEDAIRHVFQDIQARRLTSLHHQSTRLPTRLPHSPGPIAQADPLPTVHDDHRVVLPKLIHQAGGISGLGTKQFSDHDKFAAMVNFLSRPVVLDELLQMFDGEPLPFAVPTPH